MVQGQILIPYPCESKANCHPISLLFDRGLYKIEVWGGQGGNLSSGEVGGGGGYASGVFNFFQPQTLYFYIGAGGLEGTSGLTLSTYNGGGRGTFYGPGYSAGSGGGGTDVRINHSLSSRLIVAGGGSGASANLIGSQNNGACGGGAIGEDGENGKYNGVNYLGGGGGKIDSGGAGAESGLYGYGGNTTSISSIGSGGGGGWYGGGSGTFYGAAGGGGSGYIDSSIIKGQLISGCQSIPSFYHSGSFSQGHIGNGGARVTIIFSNEYSSNCVSSYLFSCFLPMIWLMSVF